MEHNKENHDEIRCRDYKEEVATLEKRLWMYQEENEALKCQVECLKECIVMMSIARYCKNDGT